MPYLKTITVLVARGHEQMDSRAPAGHNKWSSTVHAKLYNLVHSDLIHTSVCHMHVLHCRKWQQFNLNWTFVEPQNCEKYEFRTVSFWQKVLALAEQNVSVLCWYYLLYTEHCYCTEFTLEECKITEGMCRLQINVVTADGARKMSFCSIEHIKCWLILCQIRHPY